MVMFVVVLLLDIEICMCVDKVKGLVSGMIVVFDKILCVLYFFKNVILFCCKLEIGVLVYQYIGFYGYCCEML